MRKRTGKGNHRVGGWVGDSRNAAQETHLQKCDAVTREALLLLLQEREKERERETGLGGNEIDKQVSGW